MTVVTKAKKTIGNVFKGEVIIHNHIHSIEDNGKSFTFIIGDNYKIVIAKDIHDIISVF